MKTPPMSEADLASRVVRWLEDAGWDVYQEITFGGGVIGDGRADIVAVRGDELWAIECKKALSFDLMAQTERWKPYSSRASMAVLAGPRMFRPSEGRQLARRLVASLGLGLLEVRSLWPIEEGRIPAVEEKVEAAYREGYSPRLRNLLRPEHKTHAQAGGNRGGHFTKFRATCEAVARFAAENPGKTLKETLMAVDHHYMTLRSATSSIGKWIARGRIRGVELRAGEDGIMRVYPTEAA